MATSFFEWLIMNDNYVPLKFKVNDADFTVGQKTSGETDSKLRNNVVFSY